MKRVITGYENSPLKHIADHIIRQMKSNEALCSEERYRNRDRDEECAECAFPRSKCRKIKITVIVENAAKETSKKWKRYYIRAMSDGYALFMRTEHMLVQRGFKTRKEAGGLMRAMEQDSEGDQ